MNGVILGQISINMFKLLVYKQSIPTKLLTWNNFAICFLMEELYPEPNRLGLGKTKPLLFFVNKDVFEPPRK